MNEGKDLNLSNLLDYYADMLTDKQRDVIELYYNEDMSLGEIAEYAHITRQGVRDSIKRGEQILYEMEEKLGYCKKARIYQNMIKSIEKLASDIVKESLVSKSRLYDFTNEGALAAFWEKADFTEPQAQINEGKQKTITFGGENLVRESLRAMGRKLGYRD